MTAPIDDYNAFVAAIRKEFEHACPDIPLCKQRVADVFKEAHMHADTGDEMDLYKISMLAFDLGLEIKITFVKRTP